MTAPWDDDHPHENDGSGCGDELADAFDVYTPPADEFDGSGELPESDGDSGVPTLMVTATNPAASVSVTVLIDGTVWAVELSPEVSALTEAELGVEVATIARLARRQAQAAIYLITADQMDGLGHDPAATRSFLERELHLPSPESVHAEREALFAEHYARDVHRDQE